MRYSGLIGRVYFVYAACLLLPALAWADTPGYRVVQPVAGDAFELLEGFELFEPTLASTGKPLQRWGGSAHVIRLIDGRLAMVSVSNNALSLLFSADNGVTWSEPADVATRLPEKTNTARANLVELPGGRLLVVYYAWEKYKATDPADSVNNLHSVETADEGKAWSAPQIIFKGYVGMLQGAIRTRAGRVIVPICNLTGSRRFSGLCVVSADDGKTWQESNILDVPDQPTTRPYVNTISRGAIEPTVAELPDGRVLMLIRTVFDKVWQSESADGGLTWSKPTPSPLDCGGPIHLATLPSGLLAAVWNPANYLHKDTKRLGLAIGYDSQSIGVRQNDGTWFITRQFVRQIDKKNRVVHSMITGLPDGTILLTLPGRSTFLRTSETQLLRASAEMP